MKEAQIRKMLRRENASPWVCMYFYKMVIQAVLLFGNKSWNLTLALLTRLEGFHIQCAYRMAWTYMWKHGLTNSWVYPTLSDVLKECVLQTIDKYIRHWQQSITSWVMDHPLFAACWEGERIRGSPCRQWWWEQEMELDLVLFTVAVTSNDKTTLGSSSSVGDGGDFSGWGG